MTTPRRRCPGPSRPVAVAVAADMRAKKPARAIARGASIDRRAREVPVMAMPRLRIAFLVLLLIGGGFAVGCRETSPAATAGPVARVLPVELLERHLLLSTR